MQRRYDVAVEPPYRSSPVSFSRRGGRLGERQQRAWDELAVDHVLDVPRAGPSTSVDPGFRLDLPAIYGRTAPLILEIGSGYGETLAHAARAHPDIDFLAFEVYIPAVAQTLLHIRREKLTNIRLVVANAPEMLTTALEPDSLSELRIWFPDPWHKTRHQKRRLINADFAALAARVLPAGGTWRIATDWAHYAEQIAGVLVDSPDFEGGACERFEGRPVTRFETKGLAKDRVIHDFCATRVAT